MYVAVKGGEKAIDAAHAWLAEERRGDPSVAELSVAQIRQQLALAVNRVMAEGSLYDPDLAALAIKQARGDLIEAIFLIRAYRTTLPRFGASTPVETAQMAISRRISATFKDLPGGQILGPTFDYTHRLLDFKLAAEGEVPPAPTAPASLDAVSHVTGLLNRDGLIQSEPQDLAKNCARSMVQCGSFWLLNKIDLNGSGWRQMGRQLLNTSFKGCASTSPGATNTAYLTLWACFEMLAQAAT